VFASGSISGDDDLRPAVEEAQALGVRVHLLGLSPARENQAAALVQAAEARSMPTYPTCSALV
jgi:uncharacterized LabA/DUF88 family protein